MGWRFAGASLCSGLHLGVAVSRDRSVRELPPQLTSTEIPVFSIRPAGPACSCLARPRSFTCSAFLAALATFSLFAAACSDNTSPSGGSCTATQVITVGNPVSASLAGTDCLNVDGMYEDKWILTIAATTNLQFDLTSTVFDTFLSVLDSDGDEIDSNDDIDVDDTNSQLVISLGAGTYTIIATSFFPNRTGAYQLAVAVAP